EPTIGTPSHPKHSPAMAAQQPGLGPADNIPDDHQQIRASTGEQPPIGTPIESVQRDSVAGHNTHTLPTRNAPHAYAVIITAPAQHRHAPPPGRSAVLEPTNGTPSHPDRSPARAAHQPGLGPADNVPHDNQPIGASTGKQPPIGTPSQCKHRASVAGVDLEIC